MKEFLLYDCFLFTFYFGIASIISYYEGHNFKNPNLQKEMIKGSKDFLIQLPLSNVFIYTLLDYTYIGEYWSIMNCIYYLMFYDTIIFWFHWLMHKSPYLYKHIHKKHHQTLYVSAFSTTILDVKEEIITGLLPSFIPLFFIRLNYTSWGILNLLVFFHGLLIHSTIQLPYERFLLGSKSHSIHHIAKNTNFGLIFPWWDMLLSTQNTLIQRETIVKKIKNKYS